MMFNMFHVWLQVSRMFETVENVGVQRSMTALEKHVMHDIMQLWKTGQIQHRHNAKTTVYVTGREYLKAALS